MSDYNTDTIAIIPNVPFNVSQVTTCDFDIGYNNNFNNQHDFLIWLNTTVISDGHSTGDFTIVSNNLFYNTNTPCGTNNWLSIYIYP